MKPILIALCVICGGFLLFSCRQNNLVTLNYQTLKYDTNRIVIFKWDTTKYSAYNSDPLPLNQGDLGVIDSLVKDAVDSFNSRISRSLYQAFDGKVPLDSFVIQLDKYRFQYFPVKDVNGHRVVKIIGFSTVYPQWKKEVYHRRLHYGIGMFQLKLNLSEKSRNDLRSGNFG
ncbi:MAG: hypothetical protein ACJ75B_09420 [Flavisolibacter sp.]